MGSTIERPPTPISKTSVKGSHSSLQQEPQSTLLQEKLQKERRSEIQRNLNRIAGEMSSAGLVDPKTATVTPARCSTAGGSFPEPKDENGETGEKKGLALKEMEQTMSTLHKQNFDLKLELFHRRERQTILEDKIDTLEAEKVSAQETNETLMQELERRDKAVEEAVHMIVSLEGRIELLLREREMVRQMEADKDSPLRTAQAQSTSQRNGADSPESPDTTVVREARGLARMPSFLSVHTENTENLRNVYLGTQGSLLSLSRTDPRLDTGGFMSPSMSVLSESSFVSIYGKKAVSEQPSHHVDGKAPLMETPTRPNKNERLGSRDGAKEAIEGGDTSSPLQKLEKLDSSPVMDEDSHPSLASKSIERAATVKPFKTQTLVRVRDNKGKPTPSRRVITDVPASRNHVLPPTPDTMSSSMNHGSDDTPHRDHHTEDARYSGLTRLNMDQKNAVDPHHWRFKDSDVAQPPSVTAFTGRNEFSAATYFENRPSVLRRPRSADGTTISRHKNDWDSGSEPDDGASEVSSYDYWMREGLRPSNGGLGRATQHRPSTFQKVSSRDTSDLFGFPSVSNGWKGGGMSRALGGNGFLGAGAPLAPALDALGASLPAPESGLFGSGIAGPNSPRPTGAAVAPPPAPYRRSSLQARTLAPGTLATARTSRTIGKYHESESARTSAMYGQVQGSPSAWQTHNSRSTTPTPPNRPAVEEEGATDQKRHYPPNASQQQQQQPTARPRSRGLTSLFRRSLGTAHPQPSASVPNSQSPFPPPTNNDQIPFAPVGVPTWERRNYRPGEEASATPPPILRNRAPSTDMGATDGADLHPSVRTARAGKPNGNPGLGAGLSAVLATHDGGAPLNSSSQEHESAPASAGHGHGRRWFGLGARVAGLKHGGT
ncbi:hypothetical protein VP1G_00662 [Cytospora mali]|uniref:Centrosomin N-terminal motif 1 domain-containing protein n=1 Tax=Cytospora mali TaxID=578113 RepID=A0A194UNK3_CYTMA|nr:hypothetical protein VP1G_00662 [Valsa mali var. pyri (nom. inval.)]